MSTLVWSVVTTVEGRVPVASEVVFFEELSFSLPKLSTITVY